MWIVRMEKFTWERRGCTVGLEFVMCLGQVEFWPVGAGGTPTKEGIDGTKGPRTVEYDLGSCWLRTSGWSFLLRQRGEKKRRAHPILYEQRRVPLQMHLAKLVWTDHGHAARKCACSVVLQYRKQGERNAALVYRPANILTAGCSPIHWSRTPYQPPLSIINGTIGHQFPMIIDQYKFLWLTIINQQSSHHCETKLWAARPTDPSLPEIALLLSGGAGLSWCFSSCFGGLLNGWLLAA